MAKVGAGKGAVAFQVWLDDKKVFDSGVMRSGDARKDVDMRIEGHSKRLRLVTVAADVDGGSDQDHAFWGAIRLHKDVEWGDGHAVDAGPFQHRYAYPFPEWLSESWEDMATLANAVDRDIWVNPPIAVSDDCVRRLADMLRDRLHPQLRVYVEYSNEVWNFDTAKWYVHCVGRLHGLSREQQYASRAAQISRIFHEEFAKSSRGDESARVSMVYGGQLWPEWQAKGLAYVQAAIGPPNQSFDLPRHRALHPTVGSRWRRVLPPPMSSPACAETSPAS